MREEAENNRREEGEQTNTWIKYTKAKERKHDERKKRRATYEDPIRNIIRSARSCITKRTKGEGNTGIEHDIIM